ALGYSDVPLRPPGSVPTYSQSDPPYSTSSAPATPSPARSSRGYETAPMNDPMSESGGSYTPPRSRTRVRPAPAQQEEYSPAPDDDIARENMPYPDARNRPLETQRDAPQTVVPTPAPQAFPVPLGQNRLPVNATASIQPAATLACPIVSALDRWVVDSVQPSAMRWFNQPVIEIRQISAYSCRGMNGQIGARISEHAFGNALDIASFTLADGRKVSVKEGWRGLPEEQGFLRDVQAAACDQFTTVLAPGSNRFHYDHIHVDLMRRSSGRRICNPHATSGAEVAAQAAGSGRGLARRELRYDNADSGNDPFAYRGGSAGPTGSIASKGQKKARSIRDIIDDEEALVD
ncbi:MAG TPA: extensin family protein, partial [Xanthobacteraceae bacterium]|nr:extensin family protein [Xanthobacteraceae bacterium]